jgi:hypothetical protein
MERKSWWKSWGVGTCVRVDRGGGFKRCCLQTGRYDGVNRDYFFPGVAGAGLKKQLNGPWGCGPFSRDRYGLNREFAIVKSLLRLFVFSRPTLEPV